MRVFPPLYMLRLLTQPFRWSGGKWRASARLGSAQCCTFSPLLKANVIFPSFSLAVIFKSLKPLAYVYVFD